MTTERTATGMMQVALAHDDTRCGEELGQRAGGLACVTEGDGGSFGLRVLRMAPVAVIGKGCQGGEVDDRVAVHRASGSWISETIIGPVGGGDMVEVAGGLAAGRGVGSRFRYRAAVCDMGGLQARVPAMSRLSAARAGAGIE